MAIFRLCALALVANFAAILASSHAGDANVHAAMAAEDECGSEGVCAMNAMQLRANVEVPKTINPVVIRGNFMYDAVTGKRFFAKGVAYNPRNIKYSEVDGQHTASCTSGTPPFTELTYAEDPVTDKLEDQWTEPLKAIAKLGANVVRLYNIDPEANHSKFMNAAAKLGLYVIVPLTRKDWGFLPAFASPDCYTQNITDYGVVGVNVLTSAKLIVKQFSQFDNLLLFTVANEMTVNDKNGFSAFPCVKALTRDIHEYQTACSSGMRKIPLIYSDMDMGSPDRGIIGQYLTCSLESPADAVDVYGLNVYSWCDPGYPDDTGKDNFNYSPYFNIKKDFEQFAAPFMFTEFGCNTGAWQMGCPYKGGRNWTQVKAIMEDMGEVISGAIAFEFSMEKNQYGLALTPGFLEGQDKQKLLDNYFALQKQFKKYDVNPKWNAKAAQVAKCSFEPGQIAPMATLHTKPKCPSASVAKSLQTKHRVDTVADWMKLPPRPDAPLANVNNQSECPSWTVDKTSVEATCNNARVGLVEEDASEFGETDGDFGTASICVPTRGCSRNDKCQKLGNDGGRPITGTVDCKHCVGARKCQVFGVGSAFTCGCTVR